MFDNWYVVQVRTGKEEEAALQWAIAERLKEKEISRYMAYC